MQVQLIHGICLLQIWRQRKMCTVYPARAEIAKRYGGVLSSFQSVLHAHAPRIGVLRRTEHHLDFIP